jgi:ribosome-associated protein
VDNNTHTNESSGDPGGGAGGVAVAPGVVVPDGTLRFAYSRSSGPGGQNVNKLSTKAELRVGVDDLPVNGRVRGRLRALAGRRIVDARTFIDEEGRERTVGGDLVLVSEEHRSQARNREACLEKLRGLILEALVEPKVRRKTKPSRGSKERRLNEKKRRGDIKRDRGDRHD